MYVSGLNLDLLYISHHGTQGNHQLICFATFFFQTLISDSLTYSQVNELNDNVSLQNSCVELQ